MKRKGFSLLEIIIATAVLAASAMVLSSLIGLGTRYGNRAEERTRAVSQAESLLDEFLASLNQEDNQLEERTGELPGVPPRGFRISSSPFPIGTANSNRLGDSLNEAGSGVLQVSVLQVTVEVFETQGSSLSGAAKPLVELSRLIRQPQRGSNSVSSAAPQTTAQEVDSSLQGGFP